HTRSYGDWSSDVCSSICSHHGATIAVSRTNRRKEAADATVELDRSAAPGDPGRGCHRSWELQRGGESRPGRVGPRRADRAGGARSEERRGGKEGRAGGGG